MNVQNAHQNNLALGSINSKEWRISYSIHYDSKCNCETPPTQLLIVLRLRCVSQKSWVTWPIGCRFKQVIVEEYCFSTTIIEYQFSWLIFNYYRVIILYMNNRTLDDKWQVKRHCIMKLRTLPFYAFCNCLTIISLKRVTTC